jgi:type II secretory pathway pseudopilin PulG
LIELLIVIAIIGMLVQLSLPAVQNAREAGRRTACQNNLRQIGLAMQSHLSTLGYLPTAGWGWAWIGDPDRGSGKNQPGSWAYQLLPFMEQQGVYDIGRDTTGDAKYDALTTLAATPIPLFYCSTRRSPRATPTVDPGFTLPELPTGLYWYNARKPQEAARTDFIANVGDVFVYWSAGPPPSTAEKGEGFLEFRDRGGGGGNPIPLAKVSGVVMQRQPILASQIRDGLAHTYFAGEKYLPRLEYDTGTNFSDDQSCWNGDDRDTIGSTATTPSPDTGSPDWRKGPFGSAHPEGLNMVHCDASVHFITFDIDAEIHRQMGNRRDGGP